MLLPLDLQPRDASADCRPEIHLHLVLQVGAGLRPTRLTPTIEHAAENVLEAPAKPRPLLPVRLSAAPLKAGEIESPEIDRNLMPASPLPLRASKTSAPISTPRSSLRRRGINVVRVETKLIEHLPLLLIAQHIIGFRNLLELLFRLLVPRIYIRMVLPREFTKRLPDLVRSRRLLHAKRAVIIFRLRCHAVFLLRRHCFQRAGFFVA